MESLIIFVGALAVAYLVPGPDMMLMLQTAARGRRTALATASGLALARALHVTLAALGLATLLRTAPVAFEAVRILGTGYLVWLGIAIFRSRLAPLQTVHAVVQTRSAAPSHHLPSHCCRFANMIMIVMF